MSQHLRTFRQIYDNPPTGRLILRTLGSSTTAPMAPVNPPPDHLLPRHIINDPQLCHSLMNFARQYLASSGYSSAFLDSVRAGVESMLSRAGIGDETRNLDVFAIIANYVIEFITAADRVQPTEMELAPCENEGGIRPNRRFRREGVNRIIVEHKSYAAFQNYYPEIRDLGNGQGTGIEFGTAAHGALSILFKLGKHMIDMDSRWGLLFGGQNFMAFYMKQVMDGNDIYYHMVASNCHQSFTTFEPDVISVVIAILLGHPNAAATNYTPPTTTITAKYTPARSSRSTRAKNPRYAAPKKGGRGGKKTSKQEKSGVPPAGVMTVSRCWISYPNSCIPERKLEMVRVTSQEARDAFYGHFELPESDPDVGSDCDADELPGFLGFDQLGFGVCGAVYNSTCVGNGFEQSCATKMVQYDFSAFQREVGVYEQLKGARYTPDFYGAFAGKFLTGPFGMIAMELLDECFKTYDSMNMETKHASLECLKKLHDAGYHHEDVSARSFGVIKGKVVIFDFSHSEPCFSCDIDTCPQIALVRSELGFA